MVQAGLTLLHVLHGLFCAAVHTLIVQPTDGPADGSCYVMLCNAWNLPVE